MKKKIWIPLFVLFIAGGVGLYFWKFKTAPVTYQEAKITTGDIEVTVLSTGSVSPENRLEIKPPVAGRIESVLVHEGDKVNKGQIIAWMSSSERAAMIDSARAQGEAEVKRWEEIYKPTPIVAPLSGTIILRSVESGQTFASTDAVLVMSDRLTVKATLDETDLAQVKLAQEAEIRLDSYPEDAIPAKVDQIAYEAKTTNSVTTYTVDVLPDKTPDFMRSGMTANVTFFVDEKKNLVLVPNEFLKYDSGEPYVVVRTPDGKATPQEVEVGISDGKATEVLSGLKVGDTVLLEIKEDVANSASPFGFSGPKRKKGAGGPPHP